MAGPSEFSTWTPTFWVISHPDRELSLRIGELSARLDSGCSGCRWTNVCGTITSSMLELRLPLPTLQLGPDEQVAWLMEVDASDGTFFGYIRPLALFDPVTQQVVLSVPSDQLHGTLFLPVILRPAYVRNADPAVHIWSSPLPDATDFGVAAPQFTRMEVLAPQLGGRVQVLNAFTGETGWVDVAGIGPVPADDGLPAVLPPPSDAATPTEESVAGVTIAVYTVQAGDTLKTIAASVGVSLKTVLAVNAGIDPDHLAIGQVLQVPT